MDNVQLRIRIGNSYAGDNGVFTNSTMAEAIAALDETPVYVVGCYIKAFEEEVGFGRSKRTITRKTDQPVYGLEVTVNPKYSAFGGARQAEVNWSALGAQDTDTTLLYVQLLQVAANLAQCANASF
jgi:hypothetical protein